MPSSACPSYRTGQGDARSEDSPKVGTSSIHNSSAPSRNVNHCDTLKSGHDPLAGDLGREVRSDTTREESAFVVGGQNGVIVGIGIRIGIEITKEGMEEPAAQHCH